MYRIFVAWDGCCLAIADIQSNGKKGSQAEKLNLSIMRPALGRIVTTPALTQSLVEAGCQAVIEALIRGAD
jgi:hypothetical protein